MDIDEMQKRTSKRNRAAHWTALLFAAALFSGTFCARAEKTETRTPFGFEEVLEQAKSLANRPFALNTVKLPAPFNKLTYDQYRDIRFRSERAIWREEKLGYELQMFPMGWLFNAPVRISVVDRDGVAKLSANGEVFDYGPLVGKAPTAGDLGFSGFRIHAPINRADYLDEFVVFQGASYFRGVGRDQVYGLSARGLALNTAQPGGEEFPIFREFWIERPAPKAKSVTVYALLDSPSLAGAYRFEIMHGLPTTMDVEAHLFPRRDIKHAGIAPLTSMFLFSGQNLLAKRDFRPAVHDSEALAIINGSNERLWRPLANPQRLQTSAFVDTSPRGFGLIQRDRRFTNFEDLEAKHERRPSLWIEPLGDWGRGSIDLIEIPTAEETNDNIVAFWRPADILAKGKTYRFSYRMLWTDDVGRSWDGARVAKTRIGDGRKRGTTLFVVDFTGPSLEKMRELPDVVVTTSRGTTTKPVIQHNPESNGVRTAFTLDPAGEETAELRLQLKRNDQPVSEVWLYRWTR